MPFVAKHRITIGLRRSATLSAFPFWAVVCSLFLFAGTTFAQSHTSIFDPAATPAHSAFGLSMLVLSVTLVIFLLVAGLLLYVLVRYRRRLTDSDGEPPQIYGSNQIELLWTVIPSSKRRDIHKMRSPRRHGHRRVISRAKRMISDWLAAGMESLKATFPLICFSVQ